MVKNISIRVPTLARLVMVLVLLSIWNTPPRKIWIRNSVCNDICETLYHLIYHLVIEASKAEETAVAEAIACQIHCVNFASILDLYINFVGYNKPHGYIWESCQCESEKLAQRETRWNGPLILLRMTQQHGQTKEREQDILLRTWGSELVVYRYFSNVNDPSVTLTRAFVMLGLDFRL